MTRTYVVTGSASGIGAVLARMLRGGGDAVIGIDRHDADVCVDLADLDARREMVDAVAAQSGGRIDGLVACAGVGSPDSATVAVNYFGAVATLRGLNALLRASDAPRAATIGSIAAIHPVDGLLVEAMLADDEPGALARASELAITEEGRGLIYGSTKRALTRWVRRHAAGPDWAGCGIPLNLIAPGIVLTPMTMPLMSNQRWRAAIAVDVPMPLNGWMEPEAPASLLAWLVGPQNSHICGQVIFIDSGAEVVLRGEKPW